MGDLGIATPRDRVCAIADLDRDLVDDAAGAPAHHENTVRQDHRLDEVMRDEERRLAGVLQRAGKLLLQDDPGLRVDRGEGLVEQEHGRIDRERSREGRSLAHAAGELMRVLRLEARKAKALQESMRLALRLARIALADLHSERDVLGDAAPGKEQVLLQHEGDMRDSARGWVRHRQRPPRASAARGPRRC